jgi:hypothetical protein
VGVAVMLVVLASGAVNLSAGPPWDVGAQLNDPLRGTWDTGRIRFDRVRASLAGGGYTEREIFFFLRQFGYSSAVGWRFDLTFSRNHGVATVIRTGWDPTRTATPIDGEHGRYQLLPNHRVAITSADRRFHKWREVFSYRISGKTIRLRVVGKTDPTRTKTELRLDKCVMYVMTAAPLKKIE